MNPQNTMAPKKEYARHIMPVRMEGKKILARPQIVMAERMGKRKDAKTERFFLVLNTYTVRPPRINPVRAAACTISSPRPAAATTVQVMPTEKDMSRVNAPRRYMLTGWFFLLKFNANKTASVGKKDTAQKRLGLCKLNLRMGLPNGPYTKRAETRAVVRT